jgi:hypothetical protein
MKKFIVAFTLVAGVAAVAVASLNTTNKKKTGVEKKAEKKKECRHTCPFS